MIHCDWRVWRMEKSKALQLQTWPKMILTVAYILDQDDPYSYRLDQDDPYSYMTRMILTVTYLTKTISVSLNFTTSFQSPAPPFLTHVTQLPRFQAKIHETGFAVMWHGIKSYRFPLSGLNTWDRGFTQSCGMEAEITGSIFFKPKSMRRRFLTVMWHGSKFSFSSLNIWDGGISQACSMEAKLQFPFSNVNMPDGGGFLQTCTMEAKVAGFSFQA